MGQVTPRQPVSRQTTNLTLRSHTLPLPRVPPACLATALQQRCPPAPMALTHDGAGAAPKRGGRASAVGQHADAAGLRARGLPLSKVVVALRLDAVVCGVAGSGCGQRLRAVSRCGGGGGSGGCGRGNASDTSTSAGGPRPGQGYKMAPLTDSAWVAQDVAVLQEEQCSCLCTQGGQQCVGQQGHPPPCPMRLMRRAARCGPLPLLCLPRECGGSQSCAQALSQPANRGARGFKSAGWPGRHAEQARWAPPNPSRSSPLSNLSGPGLRLTVRKVVNVPGNLSGVVLQHGSKGSFRGQLPERATPLQGLPVRLASSCPQLPRRRSSLPCCRQLTVPSHLKLPFMLERKPAQRGSEAAAVEASPVESPTRRMPPTRLRPLPSHI